MKYITTALVFICVFSLCGCNGYREIERGYLVTTIGIYTTPQNTKIYIEALSSSLSSKTSERIVLTHNGDSLQNAFKNLNLNLVKPLYFEQTAAVVLNHIPTNNDILFLTDTLNLNYDVYVIKSNSLENLFYYDSPNGILGYDIIGVINNFEKPNGKNNTSRIFEILKHHGNLYNVNIQNEQLTVAFAGDY